MHVDLVVCKTKRWLVYVWHVLWNVTMDMTWWNFTLREIFAVTVEMQSSWRGLNPVNFVQKNPLRILKTGKITTLSYL